MSLQEYKEHFDSINNNLEFIPLDLLIKLNFLILYIAKRDAKNAILLCNELEKMLIMRIP